jgi:hypothetical protein
MSGDGAVIRSIGPTGPDRRAGNDGDDGDDGIDRIDGIDRNNGDAIRSRSPRPAPPEDALTRILFGISAVTAATGLVQMAAPGIVLRVLRCENTPATRHGFATVGMFMVVVGGGSGNALRSAPPREAGSWVFWTAVQKLGAAVAVGVGVRRKIFAKPAALVAANDLASGLLALAWYARQRWAERSEETAPDKPRRT